MYDPVERRVVILRDVVFNESASWDWTEPGAREDAQQQRQAAVTSTFVIDEEEVEELGHGGQGGISVQGGAPAVDGVGGCNNDASTTTSNPEQGAGEATPPLPEGQGSPAASATTPVRQLTPPPNAEEYLDADYDREPVRYRLVNDVFDPATPPGAEKDAHWRQAMEEEMNAIKENGTWELVEPPPSCRPISLKWVYKVKRDERGEVVRHKARLVVHGFVQREGVDFNEVFAPVARMESIRLLLVLAATQGWNVHHMDVKFAFLNGELKEEVYVRQPPGYVVNGQEHRVLRLRKDLYGLRQAPRAWNQKLDAVLREMEFERCESEHALYTRRTEHGRIEAFKVQMKDTFHMSDLGLLTYYLGIEVEQRKDGITLCQSSYARKLLERSGMGNCRPNKTPMEEKLKLSKDSKAGKVDATNYRSIIGGLRGEKADLIGYSDSDMGGDIDGRRSTSGMLFFLGGCAIAWQSMKQRIVALSTCEAEYVAVAAACCQAVWLRRLLREVTGEGPRAPVLRVDNNSAIELAKNPVLHDRSKHIDIRFHYIRECVAGGQVVLGHVHTAQQLADLLTKPLGQKRLAELMVKIGVEELIHGGKARAQGLGEEC
ncbi:hypothetical protein U9M48_001317 [Paspalum notatum var. saurae]|uniref:Reverse transcriptase Ty1/copia-type domain-containing protein n=1 Tax=Paspalum notatum var. saurae TaxID=547442 RepID=A0AAQ3SCV4_PASNO